jgi:hypothetical protein
MRATKGEMQDFELREISEALRKARLDRASIDPPTKTWEALDADRAFEVQKTTVAIDMSEPGLSR